MSRTSTLILLGVLSILTPFSGLPITLRTLLSVIFGAGVAIIGLLIRSSEVRERQQPVEVVITAPEVAMEPEPIALETPVEHPHAHTKAHKPMSPI